MSRTGPSYYGVPVLLSDFTANVAARGRLGGLLGASASQVRLWFSRVEVYLYSDFFYFISWSVMHRCWFWFGPISCADSESSPLPHLGVFPLVRM